jgi:hypothetical protein
MEGLLMPFLVYALGDFPGSICNPSRLHGEIVAAGIVEFDHVETEGETVTVVCDPEPSAADQSAIDDLVAAHDGTPEVTPPDYQLADHPTEPDALIVVDETGAPVVGKKIVVGEAEIQGDSSHSETKGPVLKSPDGTRYRLRVADGGSLSAEEA